MGCQYCPLGHKATDYTLKAFPGRAFAINIHQGVFATQYATQWGNALAAQAGVTGYPSATLNRHVFEGGNIHIDPGQSYACAMQEMAKEAPVNVAATVDINPVSRLMVVKVEAYYPGNGPGNYNLLNVALVLNNVLGTQMGSSYYPENMVGGQYRHMHILRHLLTGQ
ncbi:MAG: Omp28-related outer membrane protein [Bacteroidales bacterium]|nr:Omp28-related outer membrane protein [Bacteroidales bacterium]